MDSKFEGGRRERSEAPAGARNHEFKDKKRDRPEDHDIVMETYRLAVGHNHHVKPGDIVGAIANEADIDSQYIGRIQLFDDYSTVDLPAGMPKELLQHLKKVRVRNQPLGIEKFESGKVMQKPSENPKHSGKPKPSGKHMPSGKPKKARVKPRTKR
jgi:ATP-dependent RNA helicase DeaD